MCSKVLFSFLFLSIISFDAKSASHVSGDTSEIPSVTVRYFNAAGNQGDYLVKHVKTERCLLKAVEVIVGPANIEFYQIIYPVDKPSTFEKFKGLEEKGIVYLIPKVLSAAL